VEDETGAVEDMTYGNAKLALMATACAAALAAQFWPLPFPDNIPLLGAAVVVYFGISGVLQFMTSFLDGDVVYKGRLVAGGGGGGGGGGRPLLLHSTLARGEDGYTVVADVDGVARAATLTRSVGAYFTASGELSEDALAADLAAHVLPALTRAEGRAGGSGSGSGSGAAAAATHAAAPVRSASKGGGGGVGGTGSAAR
jgi:hypothetical protein